MSHIINLLAGLSSRIKALKDVLYINIFSFVVFLFLYLFYWQFGQAKDLLITLNQENDLQIGLFFLSMLVLASICWWVPKYLYDENIDDFADTKSWNEFLNKEYNKHTRPIQEVDPNIPDKRHYNIMVPRVFGSGILILVALAIWNIGHEQGTSMFKQVSGDLIMTLLLVLVVILFLLGSGDHSAVGSHQFVQKRTEKNKFLLYTPFLFIIGLLVVLAMRNTHEPTTMMNLFIAAALISLGFLRFTMVRKNLPFFCSDKNMVVIILALSVICLGLFLVINFCHPLNRWLNPLTCANLAFAFYLVGFYGLRIIGARRPRNKRFYLSGFSVIFCMALYAFSSGPRKSFYRIDTTDNTIEANAIYFDDNKRLTLDAYFQGWIQARSGYIEDYLKENDTYPIFVVSAEGGGSMAAYWVNLILGAIQKANSAFYSNHLFAMTGASGGTTGNAVFFLLNEVGTPPDSIQSHAKDIFIKNYLSSGITRLFGADFWSSLLFIGGLDLFDNRSEILERQWSRAIKQKTGHDAAHAFDDPLMKFWYDEGTHARPSFPPLVIFSTTYIQNSGPAHFAPVKLDDAWPRSIDLLEVVHRQYGDQKTVKMSSANVANASFPYVNNTTFIDSLGNFGDAGYYDNFGGQMATNMGKRLKKIIETDTLYPFSNRLKFISLVVQNSRIEPPPPPSGSDVQALAPVMAASGVMGAYYFYNRDLLSEVYDTSYWLALTKERVLLNNKDTVNVQVPVSRYLSGIAMDAMKASADKKVQNPQSTLSAVIRAMRSPSENN